MKINFLEYKKKKEAELNLLKRLSIIFIGLGTFIIVLMKGMDVLFTERLLFIVICICFALLFAGASLQLFFKIKCPKCSKDVAFKEGDFCCHCGCDFKQELQEVDDFL